MPITEVRKVQEALEGGVGGTSTTGISKAMAYRMLKERGYTDEVITKKLQPETKSPSFLKALAEELPEYGGAFLGGLKGAAVGAPAGPLGVFVGAVGGAAFGGMAGKATQQIGKQIGGDPTAPQTSMEAAKEIGMAGVKQAAYEAGGRIVVGGIGKVLAPFAKSVTPEAKIAQDTLGKYMPKEKSPIRIISRIGNQKVPALLPAEATENRILDIMENIAEGSLIGGKKIADYKNVIRPQAISSMADDIVKMFGKEVEPDMVGDAFVLAVEGKLKPSRLAATTLYNTVDDMTKNLAILDPITKQKAGIVSLTGLKEFAKPLAKTAEDIGGIEAKNSGDDLIHAIMNLGDNIDFATAKELRSRLISRIDEFSIINKKAPAIGKAKRAISLIDEATSSALEKHNPEALVLWRQANKLYREGSEQFDNEFIRRLIKQGVDKGNPEVIAKGIFKPNAISNIRKAKAAVDEKTWTELQSWYVQDIMKKATAVDGKINGDIFVNQLIGKTGMGEQALTEIFKPAELQALKNVGSALRLATHKQAEGVGKMWIQLTQAGAVVGLFDERSRPYSVALLGGPAVIARLFTNPIAAKWLIQGVRLPAGSPQTAAIIIKLSGMAAEIKKNMDKEKEANKALPPDVAAYKEDMEAKRKNLYQSRGLEETE